MRPLIFLCLLVNGFQLAGDLEDRVGNFWHLLQSNQKAEALPFVTRATWNQFILRKELGILAWELVAIEPVTETESLVSVKVKRMIPGVNGTFWTRVQERWVKEGKVWKVAVAGLSPETFRTRYQTRKSPIPRARDGQVAAVPSVLRIPFLNESQTGRVRLRNSWDDGVRILKVAFDSARFEVVRVPEEIGPGEMGPIVLRYIGAEHRKNLKTEIRITLRRGDRSTELEIPVVYNYFSRGSRALFGLSEQEAENLQRGDPLVPAVPQPSPDQAPPPVPSPPKPPR